MKIEFWYYQTYYNKFREDSTDTHLPLVTLYDDDIVADSLSDISREAVVDSDMFVQDAGEFSATVKFNKPVFDLLFANYRHAKLPELSKFIIRVYLGNDTDSTFDGMIKFDGNTCESEFNNISFSAWDFLYLINNPKPAETDVAANFNCIDYLDRFFTWYRAGGIWDHDVLGQFYFDFLLVPSTNFSPFIFDTTGRKLEPLTGVINLELIMSDEGTPWTTQHPGTIAVATFKDGVLHVLLGFSVIGFYLPPQEHLPLPNTRVEYFKFKPYNITEFEAIPYFFDTSKISEMINFDYTSVDQLIVKLKSLAGVTDLVCSMESNGVTYSLPSYFNPFTITDITTNAKVVIPMQLNGTPITYAIKTKNKDLIKKFLFLNNWSLSIKGLTISIKQKGDFVFDYNDFRVLPNDKNTSWELSSVEKREFTTGVFDDLPGGNKPVGSEVPYLADWLTKRTQALNDRVFYEASVTTKEVVDLGDVIMIESLPLPISFRVGAVSVNPEYPDTRNITAYSVSPPLVNGFDPVFYRYYQDLIFTIQSIVGAVIYYTYSASGEPATPTANSARYTVPLSVYGNYKAIAICGGSVSGVVSYTFAPAMLNDSPIFQYAFYPLNSAKWPEVTTMTKVYFFREDTKVVLVTFSMDWTDWAYNDHESPILMGVLRYEFSGDHYIINSARDGYAEADNTQIVTCKDDAHVVLIQALLASVGCSKAYDDITAYQLSFSDDLGYNRLYRAGENIVYYTGIVTG